MYRKSSVHCKQIKNYTDYTYAAADNNISDVRPIFDSLDWSEESYRKFERIGQTGEQLYVCLSVTDEVGIIHMYP